MKSEAIWSDELQRWKLPDLTVTKTKLPPTGKSSYSVAFLFEQKRVN